MEEFVLIPKRQFVEEKTQMSQILNNPNFTNKSAHLSFLQRNADNSYNPTGVDNSGSQRYYRKNKPRNFANTSTMTTNEAQVNNGESMEADEAFSVRDNETYIFDNSGSLLDDLLTELAPLMSKTKIARTKTIFQRINNNNRLLVNPEDRRIYIGKSRRRGPSIDSFLNNMQQNTKKLQFRDFVILYELQLPEYLVSNSYAKKFLLQSIQQQQRYLAEEERSKEQNSGLSSQDLPPKIEEREEDTTANEFDDEEIDPPENWQSEYDDEFVEAEQGEDYEEITPPRRQ
jgi:hypothetical protein